MGESTDYSAAFADTREENKDVEALNTEGEFERHFKPDEWWEPSTLTSREGLGVRVGQPGAIWVAALSSPLAQVQGRPPGSVDATHGGKSLKILFGIDLLRGLSATAQRHNTSLFHLLLSGWVLLLGKLIGKDEVLIGVSSRRSSQPKIGAQIEPDIGTLRIEIEQNRGMKRVLQRIARSSDWSPPQPMRCDVSVALLGTGADMTAQVEYAEELFDTQTFEQLISRFGTLLSDIVEHFDSPVSQLSVLARSERHLITEQFNSTRIVWPRCTLLHQIFEEQADRTSDAVAVAFESASLTYAELNSRSNQLARYLKGRGVGPDQLVGICLERSLEMVIGLLGILKAGGAYVPLDPAYPAERLQYMLEDSATTILLTQKHLLSRLQETAARIICLDRDWSNVASQASDNLKAEALGLTLGNLAYVIYTSGSTGRPKGAMNQHSGIVNRLEWGQGRYQLTSADRVLQKTPYSFDVSVPEFFWPLMMGACLVMARPEGHKDPEYLQQLIESRGVTAVHFVPSMLHSFLNQRRSGGGLTLRHIFCSGEELSVPLQRRCIEMFPETRLSNLYGPTESAVEVTAWECQADDRCDRTPIGHPIANIRMYVLDRYLQPVPIGALGEIYIGGVGVCRGYLNRPELTAERFIADPFSTDPGARLYGTGDLGRWLASGNIEYAGRNDHQVKIRGFRIELGEIEVWLSKHPSIKEAAVLAREDVRGETRLVGYVTADMSCLKTPQESLGPALRAYLRERLPMHMVPNVFVVLEEFPLSANGKLDRRLLPDPDPEAYGKREYEAPRGTQETLLAAIWQELLRVEPVGRQDNFFELGGHSLLTLQMQDHLRRAGYQTDIRHLFESPTLATLAGALERGGSTHQVPPNLIPVREATITPEMLPLVDLTAREISQVVNRVPGRGGNVQDIYPLAPLQEGILFHHLLGDSNQSDPYVLAILFSFASKQKLQELVSALQKAIDRHDILRTAILWEDLAQPVQVVWRRAELPVEECVVDPGRSVVERPETYLGPDQQRLDLHRAPLMRLLTVTPQHEDTRYAILQVHHLIQDHTSLDTLFSELTTLLGESSHELPRPIPYRNHVSQCLSRSASSSAESFFRSKLADVEEPTAPFGIMDIRVDSQRIEEVRESLDPQLARRVRRLARLLGVSAATLFHAAWSLVLSHTTQRDDVVFGTVLMGRHQAVPAAQSMLGLFVNTLPIRIKLKDISVAELVERANRELIELLEYEQTSLSVAQRCSAVATSMPLFSTLLNYFHGSVVPAIGRTEATTGIEVVTSRQWSNYPVSVLIEDRGEGFGLTAQTERAIDPRRIVGFLQTAVRSLLEALENHPSDLALALTILSPHERHHVIEGFNANRQVFAPEKLIHQLFEDQVERTPEAIAVVCDGASLTYGELNSRANQLGRYLRCKGIACDQLVAVCLERNLDMVIGLLGILKAGGAYLPLDVRYPKQRLAYMLADSAPKVLLTQKDLVSCLPRTDTNLICLNDGLAEISGQHKNNLDPRELNLEPHHLAYTIYTSGSTGNPKGVMVEHRNATRLFEATAALFRFDSTDVWTLFHSYAFDFSVWELWGALLYGGRLVIVPYMTSRSPTDFWHLVCSEEVTVLNQTPSAFAQLIDAQGQAGQTNHALRNVIFGGEALEFRILRPWIARNGADMPQLVNMYGITETTVHVTYRALTGEEIESSQDSLIGAAIADLRNYVLNPDRQPVPVGVTGELYVGGAGVSRGYFNRPELTAERFPADPFSTIVGARMYKTGDLARWRTDGTLEYLGRNDHQVKIRGFRIELGEIEALLAKHESVKEAVVTTRDDTSGQKGLVAYVVLDPASGVSRSFDAEIFRTHLRGALPEYMVPSVFVRLQELPLTPSGKLDRRGLPAPGLDAYVSRACEPPQGALERTLEIIWMDLLKVAAVGRDVSFFDLGGHSLLALKTLLRVNQAFSSNLNVTDLYSSPTIRTMAQRISAGVRPDERIDLQREAVLDFKEIVRPRRRCAGSGAALLTGATGFVGRFLLSELLQHTDRRIYCLVRAASQGDAARRLKDMLIQWELWQDEFERRLVVVAGDLSLPRLGLDERSYRNLCGNVDSIYHCATSMNHLETYIMAKRANVEGARELLQIASLGNVKLLNVISTLSVFSEEHAEVHNSDVGIRVVDEVSSIDFERHPNSQGYAASKWVAEKLFLSAAERGIPCNIFRLGLVWADTLKGRYDELQREHRFLVSSMLSGCGIQDYRYQLAPTPVDHVSRAVVFLANRHDDGGGIFHLASPDQSVERVFERLNAVMETPLELLTPYEWMVEIRRLHKSGRSLPVVPLVEAWFSMDETTFVENYRRVNSSCLHVDCTATTRELESAGISTPPFDDALLLRSLQYACSRNPELRSLLDSQGDSRAFDTDIAHGGNTKRPVRERFPRTGMMRGGIVQ